MVLDACITASIERVLRLAHSLCYLRLPIFLAPSILVFSPSLLFPSCLILLRQYWPIWFSRIRWVDLQLQFLQTIRLKAVIWKTLGHLPSTLCNLYEEIYIQKFGTIRTREDSHRSHFPPTIMLARLFEKRRLRAFAVLLWRKDDQYILRRRDRLMREFHCPRPQTRCFSLRTSLRSRILWD